MNTLCVDSLLSDYRHSVNVALVTAPASNVCTESISIFVNVVVRVDSIEITGRQGVIGEPRREGDRCDTKRRVSRGRDECDREDME